MSFEPDNQGRFQFVWKSYADLAADVRVWCNHLPPLAAVAGLPRSGLLVATLVALYRNIPLITGSKPYASREQITQPSRDNPILYVDDSCWTGGSINRVRENARNSKLPVVYGCYMCHHQRTNLWDYVFLDTVYANHLMEWSSLHIPFNYQTMVDLDGVLAEDWSGPEEGQYEPGYKKHVEGAKCLIKPTYPLHSICTSRLEKWRPETEAWLWTNGIQYSKLLMNPAPTAQARIDGDGFSGWKSHCYEANPEARLFIESSSHQAQAIGFRTQKPVLDWEKRLLYQSGRILQSRVAHVNTNNNVTVNRPTQDQETTIGLPI